MLLLRWVTLVAGLGLASDDLRDDGGLLAATVVLVAYTMVRTVRPIRGDERVVLLALMAEMALTVIVVDATGYWSSPLAFSLLATAAVAGFAGGFAYGLRVAVVIVVTVSLPWSLDPMFGGDDPSVTLQWSTETVLVVVMAGYARRISGEADRRQHLAMDRVTRLSDANALLFSLNQVAQTLPASLDLAEVLDSTMEQIAALLDHDASAILLFDDTENRWQVARRSGVRPPSRLVTAELPPPLNRARRLRTVHGEPNLLARGGPGLDPGAGSGLYAVLATRGSVIGLLSVEHADARHFDDHDLELLAGLAEPAALAIDNARWFGRLRTVGADEERTRIARDLHDRIGQSLAYLAFELDRVLKNARKSRTDEETVAALGELRGDVRGVIGEVRDTLYDLRTEVTDSHGLVDTLEQFLARVGERSGLDVVLRSEQSARLPILQERELWRIAQEAVVNVERHARAATLTVSWSTDGHGADLEVADDGRGMPVGRAGRFDSYGMIGMRERAASIGATLTFESTPGRGTRVRATLADHHPRGAEP